MDFKLTETQCEETGGHCFEMSNRVVATNPPVYHQICKHCGLVEEGRAQSAIGWYRDSDQPYLRKEGS